MSRMVYHELGVRMILSLETNGGSKTERLTVEDHRDDGWGVVLRHNGSESHTASVLVPLVAPIDLEPHEATLAELGPFPTQAQAVCAVAIRLLALLAIVTPNLGELDTGALDRMSDRT